MKNTKNTKKNSLLTLLIILAIGVFAVFIFNGENNVDLNSESENNEDFPENNQQENSGDASENDDVSENDNEDLEKIETERIIINNPRQGQVISSPLVLEGEVRGRWLFEADASVILTDWDGRVIGETYIETNENWMTEKFVTFSGTIEFEEPEDIGDFSDKGSIIFQKANPSGLPENDDAVEFQILFR